MAVILSVIVALVIIGGIQSITKVSERLVPFMAAFYVLGCLIILIMNADVLGQSIGVIVSSAFTAKAVRLCGKYNCNCMPLRFRARTLLQ